MIGTLYVSQFVHIDKILNTLLSELNTCGGEMEGPKDKKLTIAGITV